MKFFERFAWARAAAVPPREPLAFFQKPRLTYAAGEWIAETTHDDSNPMWGYGRTPKLAHLNVAILVRCRCVYLKLAPPTWVRFPPLVWE